MGLFGRKKEGKAKEHTDPVCGMVVVEEKGVGPDTIRGEAYWFCSAECQDQYHERTGTRRSRREQAQSRKAHKEERRMIH